MKRIVDHPGDDALLREAARLASAAAPDEPSAALHERVARRVVSRRHRRGGSLAGLRPALAFGLVLLGAFAAASIWRGHVHRRGLE